MQNQYLVTIELIEAGIWKPQQCGEGEDACKSPVEEAKEFMVEHLQ